MKKIKVVMADDDHLVLEDLQTMVNWNRLGFTIVACADSGEQALACLEQWQPDLLITDICMMGMNGLDVIEKAHEKYPEMKHLIISSYDEFSYARRALENDVADYILKTEINPAKLTQVLTKIKNSFSQSKESFLLKENDLIQFFTQTDVDDTDQDHFPALQSIIENTYLFMIVTPVSGFFRTAFDERNRLRGKAKKMLYSTVVDLCMYPVVCEINGRMIIGISVDENIGFAKRAYSSLKRHLIYRLNETGNECVLFCSESAKTLPAFRSYLAKLQPFVAYYQFFSENNIEMDMEKLEQNHYIPVKRNFDFSSLILQEDHLEKDILEMKDYISDCGRHYDMQALLSFYRNFCSFVEINTKNQIQMPETFVAPTIEYFQKWIYNQLFSCVQVVNNGIRREYSPAVERAVSFMRKNYGNEGVSAAQIAAYAGLSVSRLGVLLKKETGKTVNEYLSQIRVENAVIFLEQSDLKIYEIAERCGYKSTQYFTQVIVQHTGKRPIDFRKASR